MIYPLTKFHLPRKQYRQFMTAILFYILQIIYFLKTSYLMTFCGPVFSGTDVTSV